MGRLEGLVTIITGAASGIGEGIAQAFASEGALVVLTDIRDAEGRELARDLGDCAIYRRLDVRREDEWALVTEAVVEQHGRRSPEGSKENSYPGGRRSAFRPTSTRNTSRAVKTVVKGSL